MVGGYAVVVLFGLHCVDCSRPGAHRLPAQGHEQLTCVPFSILLFLSFLLLLSPPLPSSPLLSPPLVSNDSLVLPDHKDDEESTPVQSYRSPKAFTRPSLKNQPSMEESKREPILVDDRGSFTTAILAEKTAGSEKSEAKGVRSALQRAWSGVSSNSANSDGESRAISLSVVLVSSDFSRAISLERVSLASNPS